MLAPWDGDLGAFLSGLVAWLCRGHVAREGRAGVCLSLELRVGGSAKPGGSSERGASRWGGSGDVEGSPSSSGAHVGGAAGVWPVAAGQGGQEGSVGSEHASPGQGWGRGAVEAGTFSPGNTIPLILLGGEEAPSSSPCSQLRARAASCLPGAGILVWEEPRHLSVSLEDRGCLCSLSQR